jgi:SAM-dependent methyltransferase
LIGQLVGDIGAAASATSVVIGDRLGLYRVLDEHGPSTPAELARASRCAERYCREWLDAQAASGYVTFEAATGRYHLTREQARLFVDPDSPTFMPGMFQVIQAMWAAVPAIVERFRSGEGLPWSEQHPCLFEGTEPFFRPGYVANLVPSWLPALDGVVDKLERGARVLDVGCGLGASTVIMARAFPRSTFLGVDSHAPSIELARQRAREAGVDARVRFEVANATMVADGSFDLVAMFDCLHDMEDPVGAARAARRALAADRTLLVVEPMAGDRPEQNHNPIGRIFYSCSCVLCVPHSLSRGGPALGAQAGEARLRDILHNGGGFSSVRRATETPFNLVLERRP